MGGILGGLASREAIGHEVGRIRHSATYLEYENQRYVLFGPFLHPTDHNEASN